MSVPCRRAPSPRLRAREAMAQFVLGDHMAGLSFEPPRGDPGYARLLTPHRKPYATRDGIQIRSVRAMIDHLASGRRD